MAQTTSSILQGMMEAQMDRFRNQTERTYLIIRERLALRQVTEEAAIKAKYNGSSTNFLEADIQHLADLKTAASEKQVGLRKAIDKLADVREQLSALRAAAAAGDAAAFDLAHSVLDPAVGYAASDPNNPIGHVASGTTGARTVAVDIGNLGAVYYETQSLGSRYRLDIVGVSGGEPDLGGQLLNIDGTDVALNSLNLVSRIGNVIEFNDGTTTYTATYNPGGVGVASAFIYNRLSTVPDQDQAIADIDAAMATVKKVEQSLAIAEAQIIGGVKSFESKLGQLGDEFAALNDTEITAREAELKAAQTRFDLASLQIALLGKTQRAQAELLLTRTPAWDLNITQILSARLSLQGRVPG
jgi:hypothetical protein